MQLSSVFHRCLEKIAFRCLQCQRYLAKHASEVHISKLWLISTLQTIFRSWAVVVATAVEAVEEDLLFVTLAVVDLAVVDLAVVDLAVVDLAVVDLAVVDLERRQLLVAQARPGRGNVPARYERRRPCCVMTRWIGSRTRRRRSIHTNENLVWRWSNPFCDHSRQAIE